MMYYLYSCLFACVHGWEHRGGRSPSCHHRPPEAWPGPQSNTPESSGLTGDMKWITCIQSLLDDHLPKKKKRCHAWSSLVISGSVYNLVPELVESSFSYPFSLLLLLQIILTCRKRGAVGGWSQTARRAQLGSQMHIRLELIQTP